MHLSSDDRPRPHALCWRASLLVLFALLGAPASAGNGVEDAPHDPGTFDPFDPFAPVNRVHVDAPEGTRARIVVRSRSGAHVDVLGVFDAYGTPLWFDAARTGSGGVRLSGVDVVPAGGLDLVVLSGNGFAGDLDVSVGTRRLTSAPRSSEPVWVPGRLVLNACTGEDAEAAAQMAGLELSTGWDGIWTVDLPPVFGGSEWEAAAEYSRAFGGVVFEPDAFAEPPEGSQANVIVTGVEYGRHFATQRALRAIGLAQASPGLDGSGVTIAVLDTGIDRTHPFFGDRVLPGMDFVDGDGDPSEEIAFTLEGGPGPAGATEAAFGHGTFVAGLALAVAPKAHILPVRVLDAHGLGTASGVAAGIRWAVQHGANVINLSLGARGWTQVLADAVEDAMAQGVIVVAAAGNRGRTSRRLDFPSNMEDVLAVTALGIDGTRAGFSNGRRSRAVAAPGTGLIAPFPGETWGKGSGTSFAAPLVSGAAALVLQADGASAPDALRKRLSVRDRLDLRGLAR